MYTRLEILSGFAMLSLAIIGHGCLTLWSDAMRNEHAPPAGHPPAHICATPQAHDSMSAHAHTHAVPPHSHSHQLPPADVHSHAPDHQDVFTHARSPGATLWLNRSVVRAGQQVAVAFAVETPVAQDAWIGVLPAHVPHGDEAENDRHDLSYQYLRGQSAGTFRFEAPTEPGHYEFRLHDTDANGRELAAIGFQVVAAGQWVTR